MKIKDAIILIGDEPISMSKEELENFQGNLVLSQSSIPDHILYKLRTLNVNEEDGNQYEAAGEPVHPVFTPNVVSHEEIQVSIDRKFLAEKSAALREYADSVDRRAKALEVWLYTSWGITMLMFLFMVAFIYGYTTP